MLGNNMHREYSQSERIWLKKKEIIRIQVTKIMGLMVFCLKDRYIPKPLATALEAPKVTAVVN